MSAASITIDSVIGYLTQRGIEMGANCQVTAMVGGVSATVLLVESDRMRIVVKQALDQLQVDDPWFAKPERALTEAVALSALHALTDHYVPELIDFDEVQCALVMTAAPANWQPWKSDLLTEGIDQADTCATGRTLASVLGTWHRATAGDEATAQRFDDYEAFEQLRVHPFHRTILTRHPPLACAIEACIADLTQRRECLVHGDRTVVSARSGETEDSWLADLAVGWRAGQDQGRFHTPFRTHRQVEPTARTRSHRTDRICRPVAQRPTGPTRSSDFQEGSQ